MCNFRPGKPSGIIDRDNGLHWGPILKSLEGDYESDLERYSRQRTYLEEKLGSKLPKPVLKYPHKMPKLTKGGELEILVQAGNTVGYLDLSDELRLNVFEKVVQMHDYHSRLRQAGKIVSEWGTAHNCGVGMDDKPTSAKGIVIYRVSSYDEFDDIFIADPVRDISVVSTIVLIPFDESRRRAAQQVQTAKALVL
jgi:hypothetical protein